MLRGILDADSELAVRWHTLTFQEKYSHAEKLDGQRLLYILHQQSEDFNCRLVELQHARRALSDAITSKGGPAINRNAQEVLTQLQTIEQPNSKNAPIFAELAYRTAVGVRDPLNLGNMARYPEVVKSVSKHTSGDKLATAGMSFSSVLLFGAMGALIAVATGGVGLALGLCIAGAVIAGLAGSGYGIAAFHYWNQTSPVSIAANNFLNRGRLQESKIQPKSPKIWFPSCR
jgi:hypothetical protein